MAAELNELSEGKQACVPGSQMGPAASSQEAEVEYILEFVSMFISLVLIITECVFFLECMKNCLVSV